MVDSRLPKHLVSTGSSIGEAVNLPERPDQNRLQGAFMALQGERTHKVRQELFKEMKSLASNRVGGKSSHADINLKCRPREGKSISAFVIYCLQVPNLAGSCKSVYEKNYHWCKPLQLAIV